MDQRCDLGSNDRRLGEYLGTRDGVRRNLRPLCSEPRQHVYWSQFLRQSTIISGRRAKLCLKRHERLLKRRSTNGLEPEVHRPITRQKGAAQLLKRHCDGQKVVPSPLPSHLNVWSM
uniref:Uncharacterized protein n=1 Tax=Coccidioides posadasii RMSCC 3488 TaxID=454284 RepID=A0A0J6FTH9_COCPO|nr:hypothetical protein CPAG_08719 [Coccidioides posadasii RMSCC 3488]